MEPRVTADGWRNLIVLAVADANEGDKESLDNLAAYFALVDQAKQELSDRVGGWTGLSILELVRMIGKSEE